MPDNSDGQALPPSQVKSSTEVGDISTETRYVAHNYAPLPVVLSRGNGSRVWDTRGKEYLDFLSAYGAVSFGHNEPRILQVMFDQARQLSVPSRAYYTDKLGAFAQKLCTLTGMDRMLPMNTGAEAVETAIKAARRWGYRVKSIPSGKARIIVSAGNFHGRTTTIVGFSSDADYRDGFAPFDGGFDIIPFADAAALEAAITPDTCAFLTEPMQGEGGIIIPPSGWLRDVRAICARHNVLLVLDEIQTGLGRTGRNFAFQHEIDAPDGLILGKALGGGVYPVSAFLARSELIDVFTPGSHGSTFGGNPLACVIGMKAIEILQEDGLAKRSADLGCHLLDRLRAVSSPLVRDTRGSGLWAGVECDPALVSAREVCERLLAKGVLSKETHETVVRFAPPLTISRRDLDWAVDQFEKVIEEIDRGVPIETREP